LKKKKVKKDALKNNSDFLILFVFKATSSPKLIHENKYPHPLPRLGKWQKVQKAKKFKEI